MHRSVLGQGRCRKLGWIGGMLRGWKRKLQLGVGAILLGSGVTFAASPSASLMLEYRPRQQNVNYTVPPKGTETACRVDLVKGRENASGWLLRDAQGQPLRYFFDSNGDKRPDIWSYYKDGVEVYREIDSNNTGKPDQFRWVNSGGTRWGVDSDGDGKIDQWKLISAEEVSQEILQALMAKDFSRLEPLFFTDEDLKRLELPASEADKLRKRREAAQARFKDTVSKLTKLNSEAKWLHLETRAPALVPGDQMGSRYDLIRHSGGTILYEAGGTTDWVQTGEMIQVGMGWRLVDGPLPGAMTPETVSTGTTATPQDLGQNPKLIKLIEELTALDKVQPTPGPGPNAEVARHYLGRIEVLQKILAEVKAEEREPWVRQLADSLSTAVQYSPADDTTAQTKLRSLVQQVATAAPGSSLAAYITFREMQAHYALQIGKQGVDFNKVQQAWADQLKQFVQTYPKSDDAPDCLLQLGMVSEFMNKEVEAKNWYNQLARNYEGKPQAAKGAGAVRRLDLEGQPLQLTGPLMSDPATAFDSTQLKGKVVIVYYWASWNSHTKNDFEKIKNILDKEGANVTLLAVNLDASEEEAKAYLSSNPISGTHLHQSGGLDSRLAADFGIMVLPTVFLADKEGNVVNNNLQMINLEEEVKKLIK